MIVMLIYSLIVVTWCLISRSSMMPLVGSLRRNTTLESKLIAFISAWPSPALYWLSMHRDSTCPCPCPPVSLAVAFYTYYPWSTGLCPRSPLYYSLNERLIINFQENLDKEICSVKWNRIVNKKIAYDIRTMDKIAIFMQVDGDHPARVATEVFQSMLSDRKEGVYGLLESQFVNT